MHPFIPLFPTKCYLLPNFASTLYSKMHNQAFFLVFCPRLDFSRQGNNAHLTCNQFWCSILRYLSLQILNVSMAHIQMLFNVDILPENEAQKHGKVLIDLEENSNSVKCVAGWKGERRAWALDWLIFLQNVLEPYDSSKAFLLIRFGNFILLDCLI